MNGGGSRGGLLRVIYEWIMVKVGEGGVMVYSALLPGDLNTSSTWLTHMKTTTSHTEAKGLEANGGCVKFPDTLTFPNFNSRLNAFFFLDLCASCENSAH